MKRNFLGKRLFGAVCALSLFCAAPALADGFAIYEWSAKGLAMGGAMMFSQDPSVVAYNPSAVTRFDSAAFAAGVSFIDPSGKATFRYADGSVRRVSNEKKAEIAPSNFYVRKMNSNGWLGVGLFPRFGLSSVFDEYWDGRYNSYYAQVKSMSLTPVWGWKAGENVSMAVGADIMWIYLDIRKKIPGAIVGFDDDIRARLHGDNFALGWNASVMWDVTPQTSLAFTYRSKVDQRITDGELELSDPFPNAKARGKVTLPDSYSIGIGHRFNDRTRVEANAIYTRWSSYDALKITYDNFLGTQTDVKDWENGWRYQFGIEHKLNERWAIMAGFVYDQSVIPDSTIDFMVPTGDRRTYSLGFSYTNKNTEWTLAYAYIDVGERDVDGANIKNPYVTGGKIHDSNANVFALSCKVTF